MGFRYGCAEVTELIDNYSAPTATELVVGGIKLASWKGDGQDWAFFVMLWAFSTSIHRLAPSLTSRAMFKRSDYCSVEAWIPRSMFLSGLVRRAV